MLARGFGGWGYGGYCNWGPFEGGGWFFGWIMPLLFWGVLIFLVVMLVRRVVRKDDNHTGGESALDIAKRRYAAGEINRQEFDELRAKIS